MQSVDYNSTVISGVRVTRSLVLCVMFVDRFLSFCTFSFGARSANPSGAPEFTPGF